MTASRREISPHLPSGVPESQWRGLLCASPSLPLQWGWFQHSTSTMWGPTACLAYKSLNKEESHPNTQIGSGSRWTLNQSTGFMDSGMFWRVVFHVWTWSKYFSPTGRNAAGYVIFQQIFPLPSQSSTGRISFPLMLWRPCDWPRSREHQWAWLI